jgi:hypothetical protein
VGYRGDSRENAEDEVIRADSSLTDAVAELKSSKKFREWNPSYSTPSPRTPGIERSAIMKEVVEKHFTPDELAELWGVSVDSIRRLFRDESGVLKMGDKNPKHKRQYLTLRIPESVAERVHTRLSE